MVLAATSDAIVGASATIAVGFFAAVSALGVAWIQARGNRKRDEAVEEVIALATRLSQLEEERRRELETRNQEGPHDSNEETH